ncbi:class I SAM-dependent methyltransferase [Micromonospora sp. NPDC005298]|uniref:SAM-dependent methyltransferase n=1 Tax=Micromonospora sp. NPDC005298 TaxID=3156873 RepID=UPI0033BAA21B
MTEQHDFDRDYWDRHWQEAHHVHSGAATAGPPHPYLAAETAGLTPGTALDAGCGTGAEAIWLAEHGWRVTAVDIASAALALAAGHATDRGVSERVRWVEADLTTWEPETPFDLVTTHYAHPAMPQLAFYDRISRWVAPGGTLLIVGHLHAAAATGHGHHPPAEASVTLADITAGLDDASWEVTTGREHHRAVAGPAGRGTNTLHDVVVRATRRP